MVMLRKERFAMELPDILFNKTIEQCRELSARGGRIYARNLLLRKAQAQTQDQPAATVAGPPAETVHEANWRLDGQFPWLAAAFAARPNRIRR
jgi:hypothetical protein